MSDKKDNGILKTMPIGLGGCWYCKKAGTKGNPLSVCCEFDCMVHISCVRRVLALNDINDIEVRIIARELIPDEVI